MRCTQCQEHEGKPQYYRDPRCAWLDESAECVCDECWEAHLDGDMPSDSEPRFEMKVRKP